MRGRLLRALLITASIVICTGISSIAFADTTAEGPFTEVVDGVTWRYGKITDSESGETWAKLGYLASGVTAGTNTQVAIAANGSSYEVVVPDTLGGLPVYEAYEYAFSSTPSTPIPYTTSITLNSSLKSIPDYCFYGTASKVTFVHSVYFGGNIKSIGNYAFGGCSYLWVAGTSAGIPEGVESIGESAFNGCSVLGNNTAMGRVTLPNSLTALGANAFKACKNITFQANFEDLNVTSRLGTTWKNWFSGCTGIESVVIPSGFTEIGVSAFNGCTALKTIDMPEGIVKIGALAFNACTVLESMVLPEGTTSIGNGTFSGCTKLAEMVIPNSVEQIGTLAFKGCTSITGISLPEACTSIGNNAFEGCTGLTSINTNNILTFGNYAFSGCTALREVVISEGVTSVPEYFLKGCTELTEVVVPSTVTSVGYYAFDGCSKITKLEIPSSVEELGNIGTLSGMQIFNVNSKTIGSGAFVNWSSLATVVFGEQFTGLATGASTGPINSSYTTKLVFLGNSYEKGSTLGVGSSTSIIYCSPQADRIIDQYSSNTKNYCANVAVVDSTTSEKVQLDITVSGGAGPYNIDIERAGRIVAQRTIPSAGTIRPVFDVGGDYKVTVHDSSEAGLFGVTSEQKIFVDFTSAPIDNWEELKQTIIDAILEALGKTGGEEVTREDLEGNEEDIDLSEGDLTELPNSELYQYFNNITIDLSNNQLLQMPSGFNDTVAFIVDGNLIHGEDNQAYLIKTSDIDELPVGEVTQAMLRELLGSGAIQESPSYQGRMMRGTFGILSSGESRDLSEEHQLRLVQADGGNDVIDEDGNIISDEPVEAMIEIVGRAADNSNAVTGTFMLNAESEGDDGDDEGSLSELTDANLVGEILPLQLRAAVPTIIEFSIDPNEPANYTNVPGGGFITVTFRLYNSSGAPLNYKVDSITPKENMPNVVVHDKFDNWTTINKEDTRGNIAFGFVAEDNLDWVGDTAVEGWFNPGEAFVFGQMKANEDTGVHLKCKYGLLWGNVAAETITYDIVYKIAA